MLGRVFALMYSNDLKRNVTHLGIGESEGRGDFVPVGGREVLLIQKSLFQLENLVVGERRPRLPLLLRGLLVGEGQLRLIQF